MAWVRPLYKRGGRKLQLRPIEARIMLALFLDHSPLFVAGEIAIGLSLALFIGAFVAARAPGRAEIRQLREGRHFLGRSPNDTGAKKPGDFRRRGRLGSQPKVLTIHARARAM